MLIHEVDLECKGHFFKKEPRLFLICISIRRLLACTVRTLRLATFRRVLLGRPANHQSLSSHFNKGKGKREIDHLEMLKLTLRIEILGLLPCAQLDTCQEWETI